MSTEADRPTADAYLVAELPVRTVKRHNLVAIYALVDTTKRHTGH